MRNLLFVSDTWKRACALVLNYAPIRIISAMDGSLPKKPCRTCKNRFHAACLYKVSHTVIQHVMNFP